MTCRHGFPLDVLCELCGHVVGDEDLVEGLEFVEVDDEELIEWP